MVRFILKLLRFFRFDHLFDPFIITVRSNDLHFPVCLDRHHRKSSENNFHWRVLQRMVKWWKEKSDKEQIESIDILNLQIESITASSKSHFQYKKTPLFWFWIYHKCLQYGLLYVYLYRWRLLTWYYWR